MRERWQIHRKKCQSAKKDLREGKVELMKNSGVYVEPKDLDKFKCMKYDFPFIKTFK